MTEYSIFLWFGLGLPMEERLRMIKAAGFDGVLLWWGNDHAEVDGDYLMHPEMARRSGLFVENIHTPFSCCNSLWEDSTEGDDYEKLLLNCLEDCRRCEIPTAVVHLTKGYHPPPLSQTGLDRIKRLANAAERMDINIALENLRRVDYLDYVFEHVHSKRLGFCYDSGHENCFTPGKDFLSQYGSKLMALHLHDNDGSDDQHLLPGEGAIEWGAIRKKLRQTGYSGAIALEVESSTSMHDLENPERLLRKAYEAARALT